MNPLKIQKTTAMLPHSTLLTPLTPDHNAASLWRASLWRERALVPDRNAAYLWLEHALVIGGTTNNCSSANSDSLPSAGSPGFLVQGLQQIPNYLGHWNFSTLSLTLQAFPLFIVQPNSQGFFSSRIHNRASRMLRCGSSLSLAQIFVPLRCRKQLGEGYAIHFIPERNIHEYITSVGTPYHTSRCMAVGNLLELPRGSPKHYIVPFRRGGAVMQDQQPRSCFESIPAGREGYVYLIHAEGTTRYKIGRSANPIVRRQELQKQSPYPLKIVKSFWTLDAIAEESRLHELFSGYQIFGEWFDLNGMHNDECQITKFENVEASFESPSLMRNIAKTTIEFLREWLGVEDYGGNIAGVILQLYYQLTSREEVVLTEEFFRKTLPRLINEPLPSFGPSDIADGYASERLENFIYGALKTFAFVSLGKMTV